MKRKPLSRLARARIFDANGGRCHICARKILVGERWDVDHEKPLAFGGEDAEHNMRPICIGCHQLKTAIEHRNWAKADRVRLRHYGIRREPKGRPMPGTRASGIRKRMSGQIERWKERT